MIKLLSSSVDQLTVEGEIFEELKVNPLLKKLAPERQALSAEELVHLLKADQLEIILGNNNHDSDHPGATSTSDTFPSGDNPEIPEKDRDSSENLTGGAITTTATASTDNSQ